MGNIAGQSPDAKRVFRQAACFDRAGGMLAESVAEWFQSFVERAFDGLRKGPQPYLPDGTPFVVPDSVSGLVEVELTQAGIDRNPMLIPMVVNRAFATELFLKCLLLRNGVPVPKSHELITLFNRLPNEQQARAEELFRDECEKDDAFERIKKTEPTKSLDLVWSLTEMNRAFECWRYAYEKPPEKGMVGKPWEAFRQLALELEPSWKSEIADLW